MPKPRVKNRGIEVTGYWIDEAESFNNFGWLVGISLNWATLLLCHQFNLKRDIFFRRQHEPVDSYIQNA